MVLGLLALALVDSINPSAIVVTLYLAARETLHFETTGMRGRSEKKANQVCRLTTGLRRS